MLNWIVTFFILAVLASVLGFGGLAGTFADIAKFIAVLFAIIFVISVVYRLVSGRRLPPPDLL